MQILAVIIMIFSILNGQELPTTYKVHEIKSEHCIIVEATDGNLYEYYQEQNCISNFKEGNQVIEVDGVLFRCEDNNSYNMQADSQMLILTDADMQIITYDFIVFIPIGISLV